MENYYKTWSSVLHGTTWVISVALMMLYSLSPAYASAERGVSVEQILRQHRTATVSFAAQDDILKTVVSLEVKEVTFIDFFNKLKEKTGKEMFLSYNADDIKRLGSVTINEKDATVETILTNVLSKAGLTFSIKGNIISIKVKPQAPKQAIKGKVISEAGGKPIAGTTILIEGTNDGAITDIDGNFTIKNVAIGDKITISFLGMKEQIIEIKDTKDLVILLKEDAMAVEDVVVTGYFTRKKESYTGATTTFTGKELRNISTGNLLNSLSMLDPSFTKVVNNDMGSNPNAIPEFQIRGTGNLKSEYQGNPNMPTFMLDGFEVSAQKVFDLDPNRVLSMTILKDAAATAIYGSRAANGVVIIETIPPKAGKLQLSYNGSVNFEVADLSCYDLMNAAEKLDYERRSGLFGDNVIVMPSNRDDFYLDDYNERLKLVQRGNDTDWIALPVRDMGIGHKHAITVEGGDESFRYAMDLYYSNKVGVMKDSKRDNYGGGVRLQYNLKNLKFTNYTSFDHIKSVNSPYGNFSDYTKFNPYYNPFNEEGGINKILYEYSNGYMTKKKMYNAFYDALLPTKNEGVSNNFLNNFAIEYDIISGLKLKANISLSVDDSREDKFLPSDHTSFMEKEKKGSYEQKFNKGFSYDINAILSYFKQIKRHTLNIGAVYNLKESTTDISGLYAVGFANQNMDHIAMGTGFLDGEKPSGGYDMSRMIGIVGNVGYSFADKYLLDGSVRSDGSSLFGSNNRWGTFWSVGIGWNIAKENFLKESKVLGLLKLRASIGTTGGQNFYAYQSMAMYSYNDPLISGSAYSGYMGAILKAMGNNDLKWQKTEKKNIGLDFELFKGRLIGSFNYYNDTSKDVLIDVSIAPSLGFDTFKENLGLVRNSGVELTLRGSVLRNFNNGLRWDLIFNLVHNENQVLEINDALTTFNKKQDEEELKNRPVVRYREGMSINTIWANESLGIDPIYGSEIFLDMNGKKTNTWDVLNYKPLGNTDPKLYGTFGTTFGYKGWELNASFYYKFGGDMYNQTLVDRVENVNSNENGDRRMLYDKWNKVGQFAKFKSSVNTGGTKPTSRFIEKENMIQFQSITVSYDFNGEKLRKAGIQRVRISAIGNELFTASTVRMERGIEYPFARTFSISAQLTF